MVCPVVLHMIVCRGCRTGDGYSDSLDIQGLLTTLRTSFTEEDVGAVEDLVVVIVVRGLRFGGRALVKYIHEFTGEEIYGQTIFVNDPDRDPLQDQILEFHFPAIWFPLPGAYVFGFWYNEKEVAECPLIVREIL